MQKVLEEQWPPLMRARSGNSRDNKKVSCETLSKVDWYSRRPHEAQFYYLSDADEERDGEGEPASEAEDKLHEEDDQEEHGYKHDEEESVRANKLDSYGYGEGLSLQGHHFLSCFPVYDKSSTAIASPGRDVRKSEWVPRTYPSPISHSGNLLPHSGSLLPHSGNLLPHSGNLLPHSGRRLPHTGPLKLHVGSHSNAHTSSKPPTSIKASSLIPSNIAGKSSKASGYNNVIEPSSPKVTCLGRVKIKQKYCKEMGKLADMTATTHHDKTRQSIGDQMKKLRRKKAHAVEAEALPTQFSKKGLHKAMDVASMSEGGEVHGEDEMKANKMGVLSSMLELKKSKHGRGSNGEAAIVTDAASDSESRGRKGMWRLKEASSHMKFRQGKQKSPPPDALEAQSSPSQVDRSIDLGRFCSADSVQGQDHGFPIFLANSLNLDGFQRTEHVPPPNSLLLMRNSKTRGAACTTITAASSSRNHGAGSCLYGLVAHEEPEGISAADRQEYLLSLKEGSFQHISTSLLGVKMEEPETTAMADGHEQTASLFDLNGKTPSAIIPEDCKVLEVKMNGMAYGQASFPNVPSEGSLWQRRSIMKPSAIDVDKPIITR